MAARTRKPKPRKRRPLPAIQTEYLTVPEACAYARSSPTHFYRMRMEGTAWPCVQFPGTNGRLLTTRALIDKWFAERRA